MESDGKKVAFGGMLTEGFLALLVITMVASVFSWESNSGGLINFQEIFKKGPTIVFGNAFGISVEALGIPVASGISFGILMLNAFILTTLDTSTRLNRYIVHETLGERVGGIFKNMHFATGASVVAAFLLIETGGYAVLWHTFGAANQLIGAMALFVITAYFLGIKAPTKYTFMPAVIMLIIVEAAFAYNIIWTYVPKSNWVLVCISGILFVLGLIVAWDSIKKIRKMKKA
jgi:carbon starvation protein